MIEMLGVLAIIGVLSVGGIAGYSKAMMKYRINKTIEQITIIAGNVRAFFGPQKNYIGVWCSTDSDGTCGSSGCMGYSSKDEYGCPILKKAKIFPDEMLTLSNDSKKIVGITHPFGGGISLGTTRKIYRSDDNNKAFGIDLYNIPEEACIELATYDWTVAGAQLIGWEYADTGHTKVPLDLETAVQQCAESHDWFGLLFDVDADSWLNAN